MSAESAGTGTRPEIHHSHRDVQGGWLRPAVFGVMDGLVSNSALIAGVAGGSTGSSPVLLAGFAGLVGGALSMAAGEYTSVASQAELARAEIEVERRELARRPEAEQAELTQLYVDRGVDPPLAREVARQLSRDPDLALEVHVREELGVAPGEEPSAVLAAGSSLLSFAVGALVPLLPFLLGRGGIVLALALTLAGLFAAGALVGRLTATPVLRSGLRPLVLGGAAGAVTYALGSLVGTGLA